MTTASPVASDGIDAPRAEYGRVGERALRQIRAMIWNGQLQPGEHLRQDEVARQFGISRVPVREVFKALVAEGVLVHKRNHGHYVADLSSRELAQICWLRDVLEARMIETAVWPTQAQIDEIVRINEEMVSYKEVARTDKTAVIMLDTRFHYLLWELSAEQLLIPELNRMWGRIAPYRSVMAYEPYVVQRMHDEHQTMINAVVAQDSAGFLAALALHSAHTQGVIETLREKERGLQ